MTRQQSVKYAQECRLAKQAGLPKPERPDTVNTVTSLADMEKAIITARTTLSLISTQMEMIVDYLCELQSRSAQAKAYHELAGVIWGQLMNTETLLKRIK